MQIFIICFLMATVGSLASWVFSLKRQCAQLFSANDGLAQRTKDTWEKYWQEEYRKRERAARLNAVEEYRQLMRSRNPDTAEGKDAELLRLKHELSVANERNPGKYNSTAESVEIMRLRRELIGVRNELYEFGRKSKQDIAKDLAAQEKNDRFAWQQEQADRVNAELARPALRHTQLSDEIDRVVIEFNDNAKA